MKKGLSTIISVILVLIIAVSSIGLIILWLPGLTINIANESTEGFNQSYIRSRGCLSIENIDPYKRELTLRNCGKIPLANFKLFIDSNEVSISLEEIKPMETAEISYKKCLSKNDYYYFYATADLAESPTIKVSLSVPIIGLDSLPMVIGQSDSFYCIDADMPKTTSTAISFALGTANSVLDCNWHSIQGSRSSGSYGIYLNGNSNNTIRNCNITNFSYGIYLRGSSNGNTLMNINSTYNYYYGVYFTGSSGNELKNSSIFNNRVYDFYTDYSSGANCNNVLTDVNGTDDKPIFYKNSSVALSGLSNTLSEIVLCNADGSSISNVVMKRTQTAYHNNGILLVGTDNSFIDNVNITDYENGIYLLNSNNNQITNTNSTSNDNDGIYFGSDSNYNTIDNVIAQYSSYGLSVSYSENSKTSNSKLIDNGYFDFYISSSSTNDCKHTLINVNGTDNKPIYYRNTSGVNIIGWNNNVSEIVLCNADGSNITNVSMKRLSSTKNNAISIVSTDYANLTNVNVSFLENGIYLFYSYNNIMNDIESYNNTQGIYLYGSDNNRITNSMLKNNSNGIYFSAYTDFSDNNNITDCYISQNTRDYYMDIVGTTNNFTNTNFTDSRVIYINNVSAVFNYRNSTTSSVWLKTQVSSSSTITRKLTNINQSLVIWNDNSSSSVTATYSITGLLPNNFYYVYNNLVYVDGFVTDSSGNLQFSIYLPASSQREIKVKSFDGVLFFKFDESSGQDTFDFSTYGNDGVINNMYPFDSNATNPSLEEPWYSVDYTDSNHRMERPDNWTVSGSYSTSSKMVAFEENSIVKDGSSALHFSMITNSSFSGSIHIDDCDNLFSINESNYLEAGSFYYILSGSIYGDQSIYFYNDSGMMCRRWSNSTYILDDVDGGDGWLIKSSLWQPSSGDSTPCNISRATYTPYIPQGAKYACLQQYLSWQNKNVNWDTVFDKFFVYQWNTMPTVAQRINRSLSGRVNGYFGGALQFDGIDDYVNVSNVQVNTTLGGYNTVAFWMYWKGNTGQMPIAWQSSYDMYFASGYFGFNTYNSDIWGISSSGLSNRWVYVTAIFYNGYANNSRLFIDGEEQTLTQKVGTAGSRIVSNTLNIGRGTTNSYFFNGLIDEVRIWNRSLTQAEINEEMDAG